MDIYPNSSIILNTINKNELHQQSLVSQIITHPSLINRIEILLFSHLYNHQYTHKNSRHYLMKNIEHHCHHHPQKMIALFSWWSKQCILHRIFYYSKISTVNSANNFYQITIEARVLANSVKDVMKSLLGRSEAVTLQGHNDYRMN